jgi:hypothetical protein
MNETIVTTTIYYLWEAEDFRETEQIENCAMARKVHESCSGEERKILLYKLVVTGQLFTGKK